jgi:hypothetical protein
MKDGHTLIYAPSPDKGIQTIIRLFEKLYKKNKILKLIIIEPSYKNHITNIPITTYIFGDDKM